MPTRTRTHFHTFTLGFATARARAVQWAVGLLLLTGLAKSPANAQTNFATVRMGCQSVLLGGASEDPFFFGYFWAATTFDGQPGMSRITTLPEGTYVPSGEFRPRAGSPGIYEADYFILDVTNYAIVEVGTMTMSVSAADTDGDGLPDVADWDQAVDLPVTFTNVSDTNTVPQLLRPNFNGFLTRSNNATRGGITITNLLAHREATNETRYSAVEIAGSVLYYRAPQPSLRFIVRRGNDRAGFTNLTPVAYTVVNPDEISLPAFTLDGSTITINSTTRVHWAISSLPTTLTRNGNRYVGDMRMVDGFPDTPWPDFLDWKIELIDTRDTDGDGVPSFSDLDEIFEFVNPTLTVTSGPANNARLLSPVVTFRGTARDNLQLRGVEYQIGNGAFQPAEGTTNWQFTTEVPAGTNRVTIRSVDSAGNRSLPATRTFFVVVTNTLTVSITGTGTVSPNLNGKNLEIGRSYTLTATPGRGYLFGQWGGDVSNAFSPFTFIMQTNLMIEAQFVPNPWGPMKGTYTGLFTAANPMRHTNSGLVTASVTDAGMVSGTILHAGNRYTLATRLNPISGRATALIPQRGSTTPLRVELFLDPAGTAQMTGIVFNGTNWEANLAADRAVFSRTNRAPFAGKYTVYFPGSDDAQFKPGGHGFGTATIDANGVLTFAGTLGDGTAVSQRVNVSPTGDWPLYIPLYVNRGSVFGNLVSSFPDLVFEGNTVWTKPAVTPARGLYPFGFIHETFAKGSTYATTNPVIDISAGTVSFGGGNLASDFVNNISLSVNNRVTNHSANALSVTITPASGLFSGTVTPPSGGRPIPFKGVFLQNQTRGYGMFAGTNRTGRVVIAAPPQ